MIDNALRYPFFNENYRLVATDLCKQTALDTDPKGALHINFTGNLEQEGKRSYFGFFTKNRQYCKFILI